MKQALALKVLGEVMDWSNDLARQEYAWLSLMSRLKFDNYRDFLAGVRFIESLINWLQQFEPDERVIAYDFVRHTLVYIGPAEMQHLVDLAYHETVLKCLLSAVADHLDIPSYLVWSQPKATETYDYFLRKSLFLGLSDGAKIDAFRRANVGRISNEQVVGMAQMSRLKWKDLLQDLRKSLSDDSARFLFIFLIDDFTASGTSLIRQEGELWKGKLPKFWDEISNKVDGNQPITETHFEENWALYVHHYLATEKASRVIQERNQAILTLRGLNWFQRTVFTFGSILPSNLPITDEQHEDFVKLVRKYYDPSVTTEHIDVGGSDGRFGFGDCRLPLVLEHNTPNNSIALLWAETEGENGHPPMRPLFRRRQRHS